MTPPNFENENIQTIIIHKTYTPQRKAYAKTYYQKNKEEMKSKQKEYYDNRKDELKQRDDLKEKNKIAYNKFITKLKEDPERLELHKQKQIEYYNNKKLKASNSINLNSTD